MRGDQDVKVLLLTVYLKESSAFNFANYSPSIAMEPYSKHRNYLEMTKSEIRDKQICLLSVIFEVANSRDQL